MADNQLTAEQTEAAAKELIVKFPKIERLPVDPPLASQNFGLFSFKFLPKPVNGIYGFLKFRGAFASQMEWEAHAKNIIRTVDSKHHIWPYQQGRWMPITTNEDFAQETLEVSQQEEVANIYNQRETEEQKMQAAKVREVKSRERQLMEDARRKEPDKSSIDYYAQQVMKVQQLESWLEQMRKRKRDMLKALKDGHDEMKRVEEEYPEYKDQVGDKIRAIKEDIGLDADTPIDRASFTPA
jgi:murein L,D-transpeptidase YcbB/YkuD